MAIDLTVIGTGSRAFVGMLLSSVVGSCASIASGKSDFVHQALVTLRGLGLESQENVPDVFHDLGADRLVEERSGEDFEDEGGAASVVGEDSLESFVVLGEEEGLKNCVTGIGLELLVDDLQDGEICYLVCAEVDKIWHELRSEYTSALREGAGVQEPGKE